jgi:hypothetical protein
VGSVFSSVLPVGAGDALLQGFPWHGFFQAAVGFFTRQHCTVIEVWASRLSVRVLELEKKESRAALMALRMLVPSLAIFSLRGPHFLWVHWIRHL